MAKALAVDGGEPAVTEPIPDWPVWDDRELDALEDVLASGDWGVGGDRTDAFASEFASRHGAEHGVTVTSGTTALRVALDAAGVEPGDEVIVPPYTFVATASAVLEVGAVPVFADIEPDSLCLDPAAVADQITDRTAAVIPVHLGGRPADLHGLQAVCADDDVTIVEDCAQAHGTWLDGEAVGTIGDIGCFSFQTSKNLAAGEGGLLVTDDEELYTRAWSRMNVGRVPDGDWYEHPVLGSNFRMTEFQAAVLQIQLERMDDQLEHRAEAAAHLDAGLAEVPGITPAPEHPDTTQRGYHLYIVQYDRDVLAGIDKPTFLEAVRAEGIPISGGYGPLYQEELFTEIETRAPDVVELAEEIPDYDAVSCPVTEHAATVTGWLPQSVLLGDEALLDQIVEGFATVADRVDELTPT